MKALRVMAVTGLLLGSFAGVLGSGAARADVYMTPDDFIRTSFSNHAPEPSVLWPDAALQQRIRTVLGHPYRQLRLRYWRSNEPNSARTAWVLGDIGKEEEITIGFTLAGKADAAAIERTEVLEFRESRGWEIRFPGFTRQFKGAGLGADDKLNQHIDGITGATLSVNTYERLARLALVLHEAVLQADDGGKTNAR